MRGRPTDTGQLGFDALLSAAEADNERHRFARASAHLPDGMDEGIVYFEALIRRHHDAMFHSDVPKTVRLREEACDLARRLNGGDTGILASDDAAGRVLERRTAAAPGTEPLWGQTGNFIVSVDTMRVRIELEGLFGIGSGWGFWLNFGAYAVDAGKPFLSHTGYRSFFGLNAAPLPGYTPSRFVSAAITAHVEQALKGRLVSIEPRYREKFADTQ